MSKKIKQGKDVIFVTKDALLKIWNELLFIGTLIFGYARGNIKQKLLSQNNLTN